MNCLVGINVSSLKNSVVLLVLIAATSAFSMESGEVENENYLLYSNLDSHVCWYDDTQDDLPPSIIQTNNNPIFPSMGEIISEFSTIMTPKIITNKDDSAFAKGFVGVVNYGLGTGTKEVIKLVPIVGSTLASVHTVYSKEAKDIEKGKGTIARELGNVTKEFVSLLPYGEHIINSATDLKSPATETLAESVLLSMFPMTNTKLEGTIDEVAGSAAKTLVMSYVPGGKHITTATGYLGKSIFGTPTLFGGLVKTSMSVGSLFTLNEQSSSFSGGESEEDFSYCSTLTDSEGDV